MIGKHMQSIVLATVVLIAVVSIWQWYKVDRQAASYAQQNSALTSQVEALRADSTNMGYRIIDLRYENKQLFWVLSDCITAQWKSFYHPMSKAWIHLKGEMKFPGYPDDMEGKRAKFAETCQNYLRAVLRPCFRYNSDVYIHVNIDDEWGFDCHLEAAERPY